MKKIITFILILSITIIPLTVNGKELSNVSTNLNETLEDESIEKAFSNYEENDDQITIYMFRGKGCGYCRKFLEFLNSITEEYGKYFKLQAFEVWNDSENDSLMEETSKYLDQPAEGVPYIIIGEQVFAGYAESYDNAIKEAIVTLYETPKEDRYDVFDKMDEKTDKKEEKSSSSLTSKTALIISLIVTLFAAIGVVVYYNNKLKQYDARIEKLEKKTKNTEPKTTKKSTKKTSKSKKE